MAANFHSQRKRITDTVFQALLYTKYIRLMILCFCFAFALGAVYYVFSKSLYSSRSMLGFTDWNVPLKEAPSALELKNRLESRHMVEKVAKRIGLPGGDASYEYIRDFFVKKVVVDIVDSQTFRVEVFSYEPWIIRAYPTAMVAEVTSQLGVDRKGAIDRMATRWQEDLKLLRSKIDESHSDRFDYEKESMLTETFINLNSLAQVPQQLVRVKHKRDIMERLRRQLATPGIDVVQKLSLLSTLKEDEDVNVGATVSVPEAERPKGKDGASTPLRPELFPFGNGGEGQGATTVVVQPAMVEGLQPWQELEKRKRELEEKVKQASRTYLPGHQTMRALNYELRQVNDGLNVELEVKERQFELRYAQLTKYLADLENQLPEYRDVLSKYDRFRTDFSLMEGGQLAWGDIYTELLKQMTLKEFNQERSDGWGLSFRGFLSVRDDPVSPSKLKMAYTSLALGIALALGLPFLLERLNTRSAKVEDIEETLLLPGLGVVPLCQREALENIVRSPDLDLDAPAPLLEQFRIIRSGLALNRERKIPTQVVMVTSARPGEGKTAISANLAWSLASIGERTLLIDTDLRRGRLHRLVALGNETGLSSVVSGRAGLEEAIQSTKMQGLDVLTSGPHIPGATEMLCMPNFEDLMATLRARYARIVIDTPPVLGVSETCSLQRVVDGVLMVVRAEKTTQQEAVSATDMLRRAGAKFYGFVLNGLDLSKSYNYYNYYYYSHQYYEGYYDAVEEPVHS